MFEPLTIRSRGCAPPSATSLAMRAFAGSKGCAERLRLERGGPRRRSGNGSAGFSNANVDSDASASISPTAASQRATAGPNARRHASIASAACVVQSSGAVRSAAIWFRRASSRSTSRPRRATRRDGGKATPAPGAADSRIAPQPHQERRLERLALQAGEQRRHQLQLAGAVIRVEQHRPGERAQPGRPADGQQQGAAQLIDARLAGQPGQQRRRERRAQQRADDARAAEPPGQPGGQRQVRPGRPPGQGLRVHVGAEIHPDHRQVLFQIEPRRELDDRLLAKGHVGREGRGLQPGGQGLLAQRRPRGRQPLEEATGAEEIEIDRVRMRLVAEAPAAPVPGRGAVLDAGNPLVIEAHRALGPRAPADDAVVEDHQPREGDDGREQPERGDDAFEGEHGEHDRRDEDREARPGHPGVDPGEPRDRRPSEVTTTGIDLKRRLSRGAHPAQPGREGRGSTSLRGRGEGEQLQYLARPRHRPRSRRGPWVRVMCRVVNTRAASVS